MNCKEFLKPTIAKIILLIVLFSIFYYFTIPLLATAGGPSQFGYPLQFIQFAGCYGPVEAPFHRCWDNQINYANLIGNIIIWYIVSIIIVGLYNWRRKPAQ